MASSDSHQDGATLDDPDELLQDIMFGIILDWTCKSAGASRPWKGQEPPSRLSHPPPDSVRSWYRPPRIPAKHYDSFDERLRRAERRVLLRAVKAASRHRQTSSTGSHLPTLPGSKSRKLEALADVAQSFNLSPLDPILPLSPRKRRRDVSFSTGIDTCSLGMVNAQAGNSMDFSGYRPPQITEIRCDLRPQKRSAQNNPAPEYYDISCRPSHLPLTYKPNQPSTLFLSQILPKSFDNGKRMNALSVMQRSRTPRIPSCVVHQPNRAPLLFYGNLNDNGLCSSAQVLESSPSLSDPDAYSYSRERETSTLDQECCIKSIKGWPGDRVPVELFKNITTYLSREDVQNMRLVNRHFERSVSGSFFEAVVIPFRREIYDLVIGSCQPHFTLNDRDNGSVGPDRVTKSASALKHAPLALYPRRSKRTAMDHGMRVFKGWGPHIKKFALSFELDEEILARPPSKSTQQTYESFWGEFPWPHETYNRFELTEELEITADKTHCMTSALSHLKNVSELGLSLDSGLGWLAGPDLSDRAQIFREKSEIFGRHYSVASTAYSRHLLIWEIISSKHQSITSQLLDTYKINSKALSLYSEILTECELLLNGPLRLIAEYMQDNPIGHLRKIRSTNLVDHVWKFMVQEGLVKSNTVPQTPRTIKSLIHRARHLAQTPLYEYHWRRLGSDSIWKAERERRRVQATYLSKGFRSAINNLKSKGLSQTQTSGSFAKNPHHFDPLTASAEAAIEFMLSCVAPLPAQASQDETESNRHNCSDNDDQMEFLNDLTSSIMSGNIEFDEIKSLGNRIDTVLVRPNNLSMAQKEWLLETEWAQRAFLSSYILAVVDNQATFTHVRSLTLAKVSSCYLSMLDRKDFWGSLPNITTLTLVVLPDWRDVSKPHDGWVEINHIYPSQATDQFASLLDKHITLKRSIKTLKLGYIGGGEHAPGLFARNRHILPAPVMKNRGKSNPLRFAYIEELTFVNCWFIPNVLVEFTSQMMGQHLKRLNLNSVSLVMYGGATSRDLVGFTPPSTSGQAGTFTVPVGIGYGVLRSEIDQVTLQQFLPFNHPLFPNNATLAAMLAAATTLQIPPLQPVVSDSTPEAPFGWLQNIPDKDTWAEVVDAITPGPNLAQQRFALGFEDQKPSLPINSLDKLSFESCGYVKLPYQDVVLSGLRESAQGVNPALTARLKRIQDDMMCSPDHFLGTIEPDIEAHDESILINAFGMYLGWGNDPRKDFNVEDGQPPGGTGRFSGVIERSVRMDVRMDERATALNG